MAYLVKYYFTKKGVLNFGLIFASILLLSLIFVNTIAYAAPGVPTIISYQGRLTNSSGNLLGGSGTTYYFKFSIWNDATVGSGTKLWPSSAPSSSSHTVRQGVFTVNIGDTGSGFPHALDYNFNTEEAVYLQVEVSSDNSSFQTLTPRQRINSSAFSQLSAAVSGTARPSSFGTTSPIGLSVVTITATSTESIPLSIRAFLGQAANILQVQDSTGSNLVSVNSSGVLSARQASTTVTSALDGLYVGRTATTTIRGESNATSTFAGGLFGTGLQIAGFATTTSLRVSLGLFQDGFSNCSDEANTVLYDSATGKFSCGTDAGAAGSGVSTIEEGNSSVVTSALSIDFLGNDFIVTADGSEGDIAIDYTNSGITRKNQNEIISGLWQFGNASTSIASVYSGLYIGTTATTTLQGNSTGTSTIQGFINVTGTNSTSTFSGGLATTYLNVTGTSATSTFARGIDLAGGCFSINGSCISGGGAGSGTVNTGTIGQAAFYASSGTAVSGTSTLMLLDEKVGIGTTSPYAKLSVVGLVVAEYFHATSTTATSTIMGVFSVGSTTPAGSSLFSVGTSSPLLIVNKNSGNVGIGTTTPYAKLSVVGPVIAEYFHATSTTATSTLAGGVNINSGALVSDFTTGITSISSLEAGNFNFEDDAGAVSWADLQVTSSAPVNTPQSYTAYLDSNPMLIIYGESNGSGGVQNTRVGVGTSTISSRFSVWGSATSTGQLFSLVNNASTTVMQVLDNGKIGIASTSPFGRFGIETQAGDIWGFAVGSSTKSLLSVSTEGFGTTTLAGLNVSATATSTSNVGFNISAGCFAINGTCVGGGGSGNGTVNTGTTGQAAFYASSGTAVSGTSTLILLDEKVGIGTTSPYAKLSVVGPVVAEYFHATSTTATSTIMGTFSVGSTTPNGSSMFSVGTSSPLLIVNKNSGNVGIGTTTPYAKLSVVGLVVAEYFHATSTTATSTIMGAFSVGSTTPAGSSLFSVGTSSPLLIVNKNSGNVGIGTTTPYAKLSVVGPVIAEYFHATSTTATSTFAGGVEIGNSAGTGDANFQFASDSNAWSIGYNSSDKSFNIASSTNFSSNVALTIRKTTSLFTGISSTTPWRTLSVNGTVAFNGLSAVSGTDASICIDPTTLELTTQAGDTCVSSSARYKNSIKSLPDDGLEKLRTLNPVSFKYNAESQDMVYWGFIAEDAAATSPQLAQFNPDGSLQTINSTAILSLTTKALKELDQNIEAISASTTATTTPKAQKFAEGFFKNIFSKLINWFADATNGITKFFAKEVRTNSLCVQKSDGSDVCITGDELSALMSNKAAAPAEAAKNPDPIIINNQNNNNATTTEPVATTTPMVNATTTPEIVIPEIHIQPDEVIVVPPEVPVDNQKENILENEPIDDVVKEEPVVPVEVIDPESVPIL